LGTWNQPRRNYLILRRVFELVSDSRRFLVADLANCFSENPESQLLELASFPLGRPFVARLRQCRFGSAAYFSNIFSIWPISAESSSSCPFLLSRNVEGEGLPRFANSRFPANKLRSAI
jgi:hypothetical protein